MKIFNSKIGDLQLRSHCIVTKQLKERQTTCELHVIMLGDEIIEFVPHRLLRFLKYLRWALLGHGPYLGWVPYGICYCKDIDGLMNELGCEHNPVHWRLFIDSSKTSLKAVLLHNGNIKPSVPVGYSILKKETYNTMKTFLDLLEYPKHNWKICSDLKVASLLLGLQLGYTKHMSFLCLRDSRQDSSHYAVKAWPPRQSPQIGIHNVQHQPLVSSANVLLPPLHIKLGLMENFVTAMNRNGDGFKSLKGFFGP